MVRPLTSSQLPWANSNHEELKEGRRHQHLSWLDLQALPPSPVASCTLSPRGSQLITGKALLSRGTSVCIVPSVPWLLDTEAPFTKRRHHADSQQVAWLYALTRPRVRLHTTASQTHFRKPTGGLG